MKSRYPRSLQKDRRGAGGFSLVELMIASSISAVIIGIALLVLLSSMGSYAQGTRRAGVQQNAMLQTERLAREIRQAKKITQISETGTYPLYLKIGFLTLMDKEVSYLYNAENKYLMRRETGVPDRVIAHIFQTHDDVVFKGFDRDGNTTAAPLDVKSVGINLRVTDNKGENTSAMRTVISLRNRR